MTTTVGGLGVHVARLPKKGMPREQLLDLQKQRAEEFGIEALPTPQARLTFPSTWPRKWSAVADPVNIRYRIDGDGYLRAARARFKATADVYKQEESRRIVHTRIVQRMLRRGMRVTIDPEDALDALLPARIRRQHARGVETAPGELRTLPLTIRRGPDLPPASADGEGAEDFVIEAVVATNAVITRFTKSGEPEIIERKALDSIGRWLTTKYRTMFLDHDRRTRVGRVLEYWIEDTNTGESTSQLVVRALVSKTRADLQQQIREGTLFQLSVWFGVPAGAAKREWHDKLKCFVWRFFDAEGYEASLVGMAVDPGATIRQFAVARSVGEGVRAALELDFEVASGIEAPASEDPAQSVVRFPAGGLDPSMLADLAGTVRGAPVFGGVGDETLGRIEAADVREGALELRLSWIASVNARDAVVIRGVAHLDEGQVVGLSFDHAELSADGEERGFKEIGMSDTSSAAAKPSREESYKRINELLAALKSATDEEGESALRGELDEAYAAIELAAGEHLPHPLSSGFEGEYPWTPSASSTSSAVGPEGTPASGATTDAASPAALAQQAAAAAGATFTPEQVAQGIAELAQPPATQPGEGQGAAAATEDGAGAAAGEVARSVIDRDFEQLWSLTATLDSFLRISPELAPQLREQLMGVVARLRELLTPTGVAAEPAQIERAVSAAVETQKQALATALESRLAELEQAYAAERKRADELVQRLQRIERSTVGAPPSRDHTALSADTDPPPAGLPPEKWNAFAMRNAKPSQPGTAA